MPYATNADLPPDVRGRFSAHCQTIFRTVWNATFERHHSEGRAFATAEGAAQACMESPKMSEKAAMPKTPAAMRAHLMAEPPAGHGMSDVDMPMGEMMEHHASMHDEGADHDHPDMAKAGRKAFTPYEFKLSEAGAVMLAFSRFNVIDSDNDVTFPGSMPVGKAIPMSAYGHTSWTGVPPTGKGVISERGDLGIFDGAFFMETDQGRNAYHTTKAMAELQEWSYGYTVLDGPPGLFEGKRVRELRKLDVDEVSPVLKGAGVGTATLAIKSGAPGSDAPYATQLSWYSEGLPALLDRFKGHAAARLTEGRKLSRADRAALEDLVEQLDAHLAIARGLLTSAEPPPKSADPVTLDILVSTAQRLGVTV